MYTYERYLIMVSFLFYSKMSKSSFSHNCSKLNGCTSKYNRYNRTRKYTCSQFVANILSATSGGIMPTCGYGYNCPKLDNHIFCHIWRNNRHICRCLFSPLLENYVYIHFLLYIYVICTTC